MKEEKKVPKISFEIKEDDRVIVKNPEDGLSRKTLIRVPNHGNVTEKLVKAMVSDGIYTINIEPRSEDSDSKIFAIVKVPVETLSKKVKNGFITINGEIDIPIEHKPVQTVDKVIFFDENEARHYARVLTILEYEAAIERLENTQEDVNFLRDQLDKDRF